MRPADEMMGGFFGEEAESPTPSFPYAESPCCAYVSSGRAALECLLLSLPRPRCVWVPRLICNTVTEPLQRLSLPVRRYGCDEALRPLLPAEVGAEDAVLLVNYFGLTGEAVAAAAQALPCPAIVDATTALYAPPPCGLPTFYSIRKFAGLPDGGVALAPSPLLRLPAETDDSTLRLRPLRERTLHGAAAALSASEAAEASLSAPARRMSPQTRALLGRVDFAAAAQRRCRNYRLLHRALGGLNRLSLPPSPPSAPLCYPLVSGIPDLRDSLIDQGIALPLYWPEVIAATSAAETENRLARTLLPLPLDQRYGEQEMERLIRLVTTG